jgi:hypothetical protein
VESLQLSEPLRGTSVIKETDPAARWARAMQKAIGGSPDDYFRLRWTIVHKEPQHASLLSHCIT